MVVTVANTSNIIQGPVSQQSEIATTTIQVINVKTATTSADIRKITKEFYKDTPILVEIARCESEYRQFGANGEPLRGRVNSADVGVMQINERYHSVRSKELGMDIHTLEGNLEYGAHLFKEQGSRPWNASKPCWGKQAATIAANI